MVYALTSVDAGGQAAAVQRARGHGGGVVVRGGRGVVAEAARRGLGRQRRHQVLQRVGVRQRGPAAAARAAPRAAAARQRARRRLARLLVVLLDFLQELLQRGTTHHITHNQIPS